MPHKPGGRHSGARTAVLKRPHPIVAAAGLIGALVVLLASLAVLIAG